jgi:hypothetical protein
VFTAAAVPLTLIYHKALDLYRILFFVKLTHAICQGLYLGNWSAWMHRLRAVGKKLIHPLNHNGNSNMCIICFKIKSSAFCVHSVFIL